MRRCLALQGDVTAGELLLGSDVYPEVRLLARSARHRGELELQSALISGAVRWPEAGDAPQPARLELARFDAAQATELLQAGSQAAALAPPRAWRSRTCGGRAARSGRFSALVTNASGELTFSEARLTGGSEDARGSAGCHGHAAAA